MAGRFEGKVVFITGASSGIGKAAAIEFAREGAKVVLSARRKERLQEVANAVTALGGEALSVCCDVTEDSSLDAAVAEAVHVFGRIDVVLANAGFGVEGLVESLSVDDFRRQFETNFFGVLNTIYAVLPELKKCRGRLGVIASVAGRMGTPGAGAYSASKFAVVGLTESLYYELKPEGVSVTCINPGFVESEIRSVNKHGELTEKPDPVPSFIVVPSDKAAREIVRALYRRTPEVMVTGHGKVLVFMVRHFPRTMRFIMAFLTRNGVPQSKE
jgi:NAD(P)-dependent dehydrogenase (short-subunit alcohol dehydrogenase family)